MGESRLRILHAIHDFLPRHRAGSEVYASDLCRELAARHHVTVLCSEYDPSRVHAELTWRLHEGVPVVELVNNGGARTFADSYQSPQITRRLEQILDIVEPDVLHVHSLLNLSFALPSLARAKGIPVVATLHDYTLVCPSGGQRVHRADWHVCQTIDTARCARCFVESPYYSQMVLAGVARTVSRSGVLQRAAGAARRLSPTLVRMATTVAGSAGRAVVTADDVATRLLHARRVFEHVDVFVAPSPSIADEFVRLGMDRSRIRVSDYGFRSLSATPRKAGSHVLRIGFVGTLVWHKGVHVLLDAVRGLPRDAYEVLLHGDVNVFPDYVSGLRRQADGLPVRFMGGFDAAGTAEVYASIDVLVVPSIWIENSPLVIHEAFMAGVPVIGARMGGIADLVSDGQNGQLYDARSPAALTAALRAVITDRGRLDAWARALPRVKSIAEDAAEWERTYLDLALARKSAMPIA